MVLVRRPDFYRAMVRRIFTTDILGKHQIRSHGLYTLTHFRTQDWLFTRMFSLNKLASSGLTVKRA